MVTIPINEEDVALNGKENQKDVNLKTNDINIEPNVNNIVVYKSVIDAIESSEFSQQIKNNMKKLYHSLSKVVFGRGELISQLNCSPLTASNYLKKMKEIGVVEPVKGQGKSRFRK